MRHRSRKKWIFLCILMVFLCYLSLAAIPYIPHKKVSAEFKEHFDTADYFSDEAGSERVAYVDDNTKALVCRLKMMEEAREEIILSTFDFNADNAGKDVMAALLHAADRGVRVRVVVDGISGFLDLRGNPYFQALALHENISLKIYNPVNLLKPGKLQARLHDKYVIIDHSMYLLGGRNTTDLFLGDYSEHPNIDRELFVYETEPEAEHGSLSQLRDYFENVWALPDSREFTCKRNTKKVQKCRRELEERYEDLKALYPQAFADWDWQAKTMAANKITLLSNPIEAENKEPRMWYALHQLMLTGDFVTLYTPYIICGKEMYADLASAAQALTGFEIITNDVSSGANPFGCTDYLNQKEKIWSTGVTVYEYLGPYSSHKKMVLIDDRLSIVGSYNLDMRSTYQDTELMLAVDCPKLNALIRQEVTADKAYSRTMTQSGEYACGEHYEAVDMSLGKKVMYLLLRVITVPVRRFL